MAEMTATFEPTLEVRELLEGKPAEYIVANPVIVEAEFEDGRVVRYPQEIRERIVRCRDCIHANPYTDCRDDDEWLDCLHFAEWDYYAGVPGHCPVRPDFFCAHGETEEDE